MQIDVCVGQCSLYTATNASTSSRSTNNYAGYYFIKALHICAQGGYDDCRFWLFLFCSSSNNYKAFYFCPSGFWDNRGYIIYTASTRILSAKSTGKATQATNMSV